MSSWISAIVKFLLPYLVQLAINVGLPELSKWVLKKLPWISQDTLNKIIQIVVDAISGIKEVKANPELTSEAKRAQVSAIKRQARRDCQGVGCMVETKAL